MDNEMDKRIDQHYQYLREHAADEFTHRHEPRPPRECILCASETRDPQSVCITCRTLVVEAARERKRKAAR